VTPRGPCQPLPVCDSVHGAGEGEEKKEAVSSPPSPVVDTLRGRFPWSIFLCMERGVAAARSRGCRTARSSSYISLYQRWSVAWKLQGAGAVEHLTAVAPNRRGRCVSSACGLRRRVRRSQRKGLKVWAPYTRLTRLVRG